MIRISEEMMKTANSRRREVNRLLNHKVRNGGCQRCQSHNEYLMVFDLPFNRSIWVCPNCYYELDQAVKHQ